MRKVSLCRLQHCAPDDWEKGRKATRNPVLSASSSPILFPLVFHFSQSADRLPLLLCAQGHYPAPRLISPQCKTHTLYGRRTLNRISWQRQLISQALVNIHHWYSESNAGLTPRYVSLLICILVLILALPLRLKPSGSQIFFWFYLWGSITTPVHESHQNHSHPVFSTSLLNCHSLLAEKALVCPFLPLLLASLAQAPCVPEFP